MLDISDDGLYKFSDRDIRKVSQIMVIKQEGIIALLAGQYEGGREGGTLEGRGRGRHWRGGGGGDIGGEGEGEILEGRGRGRKKGKH